LRQKTSFFLDRFRTKDAKYRVVDYSYAWIRWFVPGAAADSINADCFYVLLFKASSAIVPCSLRFGVVKMFDQLSIFGCLSTNCGRKLSLMPPSLHPDRAAGRISVPAGERLGWPILLHEDENR